MARKSDVVRQLDLVQRGLAHLLKPVGFRPKGRTLVRTVDTDLLQIIALQAGTFEIGSPPPPQVAYLRPNLYGKFTVNLGVFVPEMSEASNPGFPPKGVITDAHCGIRVRLCHLVSRQDIWWSLDEHPISLINEIGSLLAEHGMPFLDRFGSRDAIVRDWVKFNDTEISLTGVARLDAAMVLLRRGERDAARSLFEEHLTCHRKNPRNPGHEPYVRELARRCDLGDFN